MEQRCERRIYVVWSTTRSTCSPPPTSVSRETPPRQEYDIYTEEKMRLYQRTKEDVYVKHVDGIIYGLPPSVFFNLFEAMQPLHMDKIRIS